MQAYSNPKRESDPCALPNVEVFEYTSTVTIGDDKYYPGWYWWTCLPGCLPDSDPIGPFATSDKAIEDAQSEAWQFEEEA